MKWIDKPTREGLWLSLYDGRTYEVKNIIIQYGEPLEIIGPGGLCTAISVKSKWLGPLPKAPTKCPTKN